MLLVHILHIPKSAILDHALLEFIPNYTITNNARVVPQWHSTECCDRFMSYMCLCSFGQPLIVRGARRVLWP
jgi:hypothetical protein